MTGLIRLGLHALQIGLNIPAGKREQNGARSRNSALFRISTFLESITERIRHHAECQSKPTTTTKPISMKTKATFYHAGCAVCVAAEQNVAAALDASRFDVEIVHLGTAKSRVAEAEAAGVKSVPALVIGGAANHINFGADLSVLK
jgi:glutaredoxin